MILLKLLSNDEMMHSSKASGLALPTPALIHKQPTAEGPLTPTSRSLKGTNSDASETASRDTSPSSVHEEMTNNESAHTLTYLKVKECELDGATETESNRHIDTEANSDPRNADGNTALPEECAEPKIAEVPNGKSPTDVEESVPLTEFRRHTSPPLGRTSTDYRAARPNTDPGRPKHIRSQTLKNLPKWGYAIKDRASSSIDLHHLRKNSFTEATSSELNRMRQTIIRKSNQRRRDADDDQVIMGNKISEGHVNFVMAYNMLTGIRVSVSRCAGVMKKLNDADFKVTKKLTFNMDGSELTPSSKYDFKFKDYCPEVFRELRSLFGIDPADYLMSITGKYILSELGSPGKSGSFFYYSRDFRFIIKTIHHSEHKQLRRILKDYHAHVKANPNTLISQFYGLHRLKLHGGMKKVHFIVMNNLFPPHRDVHLKYDLKGSTWGRYTKYDDTTDLSSITLKDLNWLERGDKIKFGPGKKKMFLEQLESDVKLLKKINVMDYSLLLGVHDVKKGNSAVLTKLSVFDPKSNLKAEVFKTNPRDIDRGIDLPSDVFPGRSKYIFYGHDGGIRATNENNVPLPEIYYLGIIDCLTNYSLKKRLETFWRSLSHTRSTISALPAHDYGNRFLKFIKDSITSEKRKTN